MGQKEREEEGRGDKERTVHCGEWRQLPALRLDVGERKDWKSLGVMKTRAGSPTVLLANPVTLIYLTTLSFSLIFKWD